MLKYNAKQMMAVALARQIKDYKTYIVGTGLPLAGTSLAKNTIAPNVNLIFETGIIDAFPQELPTTVSDLRLCFHASVIWPQYRYIGFQSNSLKKNTIEAGFLGGGQIDAYGNLNSTAIGDYHNPTTRFTGSGGANGIATYCDTFIIMQHEKRRFCEKVDYITSPGWIDGANGRSLHGLPNRGPQAVITELGIMRFDEKTKRMYLAEYFPGTSPEHIKENTGFEIDVSSATEAAPPSQEMLDVLINKMGLV